MFDKNVFWMFTDFVIILPYMSFMIEFPRIAVVWAFHFEGVDFLTMTLGWTRSWSWYWSAERLIKSFWLSYWFSFSSIFFSSKMFIVWWFGFYRILFAWQFFQSDHYCYCFYFGNNRYYILNTRWLIQW